MILSNQLALKYTDANILFTKFRKKTHGLYNIIVFLFKKSNAHSHNDIFSLLLQHSMVKK